MAARPPMTDDGEEPDAVAFGIAAVDEHLESIDWPATPSEITAATGDPEVPYEASGRTLALSEALDETGRAEFESRRDLLDALHPVFEEHRQSAGPGILSWLRNALPV
ncbi:DUF5789 family protein [Salarchaeum japonicum]|nr:hypothetical protein [Salarchaeum japonicum]